MYELGINLSFDDENNEYEFLMKMKDVHKFRFELINKKNINEKYFGDYEIKEMMTKNNGFIFFKGDVKKFLNFLYSKFEKNDIEMQFNEEDKSFLLKTELKLTIIPNQEEESWTFSFKLDLDKSLNNQCNMEVQQLSNQTKILSNKIDELFNFNKILYKVMNHTLNLARDDTIKMLETSEMTILNALQLIHKETKSLSDNIQMFKDETNERLAKIEKKFKSTPIKLDFELINDFPESFELTNNNKTIKQKKNSGRNRTYTGILGTNAIGNNSGIYEYSIRLDNIFDGSMHLGFTTKEPEYDSYYAISYLIFNGKLWNRGTGSESPSIIKPKSGDIYTICVDLDNNLSYLKLNSVIIRENSISFKEEEKPELTPFIDIAYDEDQLTIF